MDGSTPQGEAGRDLSDAYGGATVRPRVITLAEDAPPPWRIVRRYARGLRPARQRPSARRRWMPSAASGTPYVGATAAEVRELL
ncbi:hypothetical protein GCM10010448_60240 [Streptomyces glomeratus]|uniref:Uncharacterized protein n=1 Tax=Streptomyces glomeratus TaxID=284452 RepID=A0ABP6M2M2_9ACTN